jgi:hypothetical protein
MKFNVDYRYWITENEHYMHERLKMRNITWGFHLKISLWMITNLAEIQTRSQTNVSLQLGECVGRQNREQTGKCKVNLYNNNI